MEKEEMRDLLHETRCEIVDDLAGLIDEKIEDAKEELRAEWKEDQQALRAEWKEDLRVVTRGFRKALGDLEDRMADLEEKLESRWKVRELETEKKKWEAAEKVVCPDCGEMMAKANLARHKKRKH